MNAGGNHGGSGPGETEPALLFASPRFKKMEKRREYECPTLPKEGTEFHFYTKIGQSDLVPTLAGLMGMPIPKNSLGVVARELSGLWSDIDWLQLLYQNAQQILHIMRAKYGVEWFDGQVTSVRNHESRDMPSEDGELLAYKWASLSKRTPSAIRLESAVGDDHEGAFYDFLEHAQSAMSDTASSYNIPHMVAGIASSGIALVLAVVSFPALWPPSVAGVYFTLVSLLYGIMMFASSYVE